VRDTRLPIGLFGPGVSELFRKGDECLAIGKRLCVTYKALAALLQKYIIWTEYIHSHVPHNDVSVIDRPHIR